MSASGSVRVAVRVRPFNAREKEMGAKVCVKMDGPTTILVDPESGQDKKFTFDFSYWSHDGFDTKEDGETVGVDEKYATQRMVFNDLGRDVLNSAFDGYNSCLFAYGQTGSGKSYSMVGYGKNKGIIPIVCEEMFNAIAANTDPTVKYQVVVSMLEIYNECVKDLLNPKVNPPGGLKIRSKPGIGVYVEDLTPVPVASYAAIEAQMEEGTLNRTVASTKMNATSSRAHTVFTIIFTKKHTDMGLTSETQSRMNLVDLAGSERAESTGATGDRLKEGCAINASLSALGNVISALADLSSGKAKKGAFVPYRNSALTRLLQDALGGNSRTIMICALSPADVNFDETLSTLRYADRAKQIKNKVFKMENPTDALIAKLKAENARLMAMLEGKIPLAGNGDGDGGDSGNKEEVTSLQQRLKEIEEEKAANERLLKDMQKSWEDRLREAEAAREEAAAAAAKSGGGAVSLRTAQASTRPFMVNLHEDPQMTEKVVYVFNDGDTRVGRADADIKQDIVLSGLNIRAEHAVIHYNAETGALSMGIIEPGTKLFINGITAKAPGAQRALAHGDRLVLGNNFVFRVMVPAPEDSTAPPVLVDSTFTGAGAWSAAMAEFQAAQGLSGGGGGGGGSSAAADADDAEVVKLRKQLEELTRERELSGRRGSIGSGDPAEIKAIQEALKWKRRSKRLKQDVDEMAPLIYEANSLADEMGKELTFDVKIELVRKGPLKANVCMRRNNGHEVWTWDMETFESRLFLMRELFNRVLEHGPQSIPREEDPFWEPSQPVEVGQAFVYLKALSQLVELDGSFRLVDTRGLAFGELKAEILPLNPLGQELPYLQSPSELLGQTVVFQIKTPYATDVPTTNIHDLQISFHFHGHDYSFPVRPISTSSAAVTAFFDYACKVMVTVDQTFLTYLTTDSITFTLRGKPAKGDENPGDQVVIALRRRSSSAPAPAARASVSGAAAAGLVTKPLAAAAAVPEPALTAASSAASPDALAVPNAGACSQCQENAGSLWCCDCPRRLCEGCFPILHKAPRRRDHKRVAIDVAIAEYAAGTGNWATGGSGAAPAAALAAAPAAALAAVAGNVLCSKCSENAATVHCTECAVVYCDHCNAMMHKAASRREHTRAPLALASAPAAPAAAGGAGICSLCKDSVATVNCGECNAIYCDNCAALRHKAPSRRDHIRTPL